MKRIWKWFKYSVLTIVSLILLLIVIGIIFINTSSQFGGSHNESDYIRYNNSGHYNLESHKFINEEETNLNMDLENIWKTTKMFIKGNPNKTPKKPMPIVDVNPSEVMNTKLNQFIWFGHSAFLLQLDGKNILLDPMLGKSPAPHPMLGTSRYNDKLPIEIEELPTIDILIISHDHYDHLDYGSIKELMSKVNQYYVPLGVGAHLREWGIDSIKIHEMNWWDEINHDNIDLIFTPSRHFSGRGVSDNSATLWGSWIVKTNNQKIFFSGDGGYGKHFKQIGDKYGPFDLAFMECGQYNVRWADIHMSPEQTAKAGVDIKARKLMPIHWGAFTLALHDWDEPVKRLIKKANELNLDLLVPKIGEKISLDSLVTQHNKWWEF